MSGSSQRLLTFLFEGAQSVFSHASEDRQPIKEYPTFVFVTRIECQFVNSPSNCFLSLLYLFTQLLRIEFENCRSEGVPAIVDMSDSLRTVKVATRNLAFVPGGGADIFIG